MKNNSFCFLFLMISLLLLTSCATIENRTKPPAIEHFNNHFEKVYKDLIKLNSFSFVYENQNFDFYLAKTYIDKGPQFYYLGFRNGNLAFIFEQKNILKLKSIFESKDKLYAKTQKIVAKLDQINLFPAKSSSFELQPKNSLLIDATEDLLNFTIYGSIAMIGFPIFLSTGGLTDLFKEDKLQQKLNNIRLGMTYEQVKDVLPSSLDENEIDAYKVEIYTSCLNGSYANALLIFENKKLVGFIRNLTGEKISDYYKRL